ncbi:MAG TPA: Lrp/AsnC family transcriptional regulator [Desulfovibrio sp.]|uniref:Lrp/AsnC family transcriptional regulator n=1 Tax=Desulfovibrio sp. TaxID=885 RepID=UPI002BA0BDE4|nr:Lrp/AsnC family transcriptional regulator [Desulfovibrio sp.]HMM37808.1 Lrp/AsnC family transcriptional regulator [Desulfovibrio sp.]
MIDGIDRNILMILHGDGRVSNAEIARRVGMAPSAVLERIRKLERKGVIQGYEALLDPKSLGQRLTAFTTVHVSEAVGSTEAGAQLAQVSGVLEVHYTAGQDSYLVKVRAEDTEALQHILQQFGAIPGVRDTRTTIVLATLKESRQLPLQGGEASKE